MPAVLRALALSLLLSFSSLAATAAEVWDGPPFAADPKALLAAAQAVQPAKPEEGVIVLLDEAHVTFDAQGRSTRVERLIYRVLDESGVEGWSSIEVAWAPWYHQKPEVDARVISADGSAHRLDPKSFGTEDAADAPDMFSDTRILSGPLPAVAPGSVVEQTITYRERNPLYDAGVAERHDFGRWVETRQSRLVIEHPTSLALKLRNETKPRIEPVKSEQDGRTRVVFETGPSAAREWPEWNLPSDVTTLSYVAWATGASWQDVARRYSQIIDERIGDLSAYAKLVSSAVGDAKTPRAIAERLLAAVERDIRYAGVEFGEGSIIPRPPLETLKNKYGDCKDKATLLVALLRQAGVPAHAVLIRSGNDFDVEPDLPGLGHFNHVIVVTEGADPLWIDPTDEFARVNELPDSDQGRLVLVARPETTELVRTPLYDAAANHTIETRVFKLAEDGKAFVTETSEYHGSDERSTRRYYTTNDKKQLGDGLETYAKNAYLAQSLAKWETTDPHDLDKPFRIHIEMKEATRGVTGGGEAAVGIFFNRLVGDIPRPLHRDVEEDEDADTPQDERYKPRKNDYVFGKPYVLDIHYRIEPPPGYVVRNLPKNETVPVATATLTKTYTVQDDGVVLADYRFDSGPRRITPAQYEELRKEVVKIDKERPLLLYFDSLGKKYVDSGEIGKAVAEYRRLAELHPKEALHHTEIARALLAGGMGSAARREAKKAIAVEPKSSKAHATMAYLLAHDLIGRELKNGCDIPGAIAEYRKAKELDPEDGTIRAELAMLLTYDDGGVRFGDAKRMGEAIAEYLALKKDVEAADDAAIDRELMGLYAQAARWDELKALLQETKDTEAKDTFNLVAIGATDGGPTAVAAAAALEPAKRRDALSRAGGTLVMLRLYQPAADLISAAAQGAPNAAQLRLQADTIRKAVRHEELKFDAGDARSVLKNAFKAVLDGESEEQINLRFSTADVAEFFSGNGIRSGIKERDPKRREAKKAMKRKDAQAKMIADFALSAFDIQQDGDESLGLRLRGRAAGAGGNMDFTAYVVREKGEYRFAATDDAPPEFALRAFRLAEANDIAGARHWLDWAREHVKGGGDDPLASEPFTALWTRGKEATAEEVRLAAAVLLPDTKKSSELALPVLEAARPQAAPEVQWRIDQALMTAYSSLERWKDVLTVADRLAAKFPASAIAFRQANFALMKLNQQDEIRARGLARLEKIPGDMAALQVLGEHALQHGAYDQAMQYFAGVLDRANAGPGDYNQHAWTSIFARADLDQALEEARQAAGQEPESYAILNTLAVLYAEQGKSSEAREALLQSIEQHEDDILGPDWYVVGRIAENYGITDAAIEAYQKVEKPKEHAGGSTWELAQNRLKELRK